MESDSSSCRQQEGRNQMDMKEFIASVLRQDAAAMRTYFRPDADINWHNTNEHFTVEEYLRANCEYPGDWTGEIERVVYAQNTIAAAIHVTSTDHTISCHCTSFIQLDGDKIARMDEYWGDDGDVPQWRKEKQIGTPIR